MLLPGPSPRVWGKPLQARHAHRGDRTIPTRVGKTNPVTHTQFCSADHPHACGENSPVSESHPHYPGPSPRVWGKRRCLTIIAGQCWTIPTRVGKTSAKRLGLALGADHPHACGENSMSACARKAWNGPSPRVWGKLCFSCGSVVGSRTIPTRVGKTMAVSLLAYTLTGPSPRVWGKLTHASASTAVSRTIPTRVGKTSECSFSVCG